MLWAGGNRVLADELGVGDLATFMALLISLVGTLTSLAWVLAAVGRGVIATDRVAEVLALPTTCRGHRELALADPPRFELRDLVFTYADGDEPALADIDAVIEPGQTLGIFGKTGSGKTTLVNLLTRVHTPPPGTILADDADIIALSLARSARRWRSCPRRRFCSPRPARQHHAVDANRARKRQARSSRPARPQTRGSIACSRGVPASTTSATCRRGSTPWSASAA